MRSWPPCGRKEGAEGGVSDHSSLVFVVWPLISLLVLPDFHLLVSRIHLLLEILSEKVCHWSG